MVKKKEIKKQYKNELGQPVKEYTTEYYYDKNDVDDALDAFQSEKDTMFDLMRKAGIDENQIDELDDQIVTPDQLEAGKQIAAALAKGIEDHDTYPDPQNPPGGSVVTLPASRGRKWVYRDARDAIDDLYKKLQTGTDEEKAYADRALKGYWNKLKPTIEHGGLQSFSMTACPSCGYALLEGATVCPYCGLDIQTYRARGGEFYRDDERKK